MILERLKEYIDYKGIAISAFERSIGMSNASFGKSLKNKGAIGTDKLENILRVYSDISPAWLLKGEGDMLLTSKKQSNETPTPIISEFLDRITAQAAEIGRLQQRIAELEREKGTSASGVHGSEIANAG